MLLNQMPRTKIHDLTPIWDYLNSGWDKKWWQKATKNQE